MIYLDHDANPINRTIRDPGRGKNKFLKILLKMSGTRKSPGRETPPEDDIGDSSLEPALQMNLPQMLTFDDNTEPYSWFKQTEQLLNFIKDETKRVQTALKCFRGNRSLFPSTLDPMPTTWEQYKQFMKYFVDNGEDVLPAHKPIFRLPLFILTFKFQKLY